MTKPTPGPWRVEGRYVRALKEKGVCELPRGGIMHGKVDEANARLIAAAPDLLAACKDLVTAMIQLDKEHHREVAAGLAAIAKAEGK